MKANQKNKKPQQAGKKESLEERVHRHLNDINSKITDDDIRNAKTEGEIIAETNPQPEGEKNEKIKKGKKAQDVSKDENSSTEKKITPPDLLSGGYE
jgi:hypothetical protein